MTSSRYYSFSNFLFFCILLHQSIRNCNANQSCVNPQFGEQQKITVELFYAYNDNGDEMDSLCNIINASNGLISIVYRMGADTHVSDDGKSVICDSEEQCAANRQLACYYMYHKDLYNNCNKNLPPDDPQVAACIGNGSADGILIQNSQDYNSYKTTIMPLMIVNKVFDPCFTTYTIDFMTNYFCTAYKKKLPMCPT